MKGLPAEELKAGFALRKSYLRPNTSILNTSAVTV